jgi:hypothetical protein
MATTLHQVREGEAPAELAGVYRDIRHCLRTSFVPLLFRSLAPHRGVLRTVWRVLRPNVITRAFEEATNDMRAALATSAVDLGTRLIEPVLASAGVDVDEIEEVREQVDLFHYTDPKTLLCVAILSRLAEGGRVGGQPLRASLLESIPTDPAPDAPQLLLAPEEPGGVVGEVFDEIKHVIGLPVATDDLQALGHWPEFLEPAWDSISPMFQHKALQRTMIMLMEQSEQLVQLLPFRLDPAKELFAGTPEMMADVTHVANILRTPLLRLALFAAALKVSLDGPQEARDSPYPVEWDEPSIDQVELT